MSLKYKCPVCGTSLGYEGLCWKCKAEKERSEALAWTPEEIAARQQMVMRNIKALDDFDDPEYTYFWQLLAYHNAITPEIQRKALAEKVFYPSEIYFNAPEDVCDSLIEILMKTKDSGEAAVLMSCLAMQGGDKALAALMELERSPRPWRKKLYVDPSVYAQGGGWTFDKEGRRTELNFKTCYPMVKGGDSAASLVKIGRMRDDACPHCGGRMFDMLVLDGSDERLKFLGIDGILTAACCPNCVPFLEGGAFNRYTLDGGTEILPSELFDGEEKMENYFKSNEYEELAGNNLTLAEKQVLLFYGSHDSDICTIGGFANWVQDWEYAVCPECGKPMKYLAQIPWDAVLDCSEGTLYIEFCPDCRIVSMQHQQT